MLFKKTLDESRRKPNKIWVNKGSEFYNGLTESWLQDHNIEMYSIHNEGKFLVVERFIRTLKTEIYKHMKQYQKMCILINYMT